MSKQFTIAAYDLEQIGREGGGTINVKVNGYWSRDSITLYISRKWVYCSSRAHLPAAEHSYRWEFTTSHGSGGREKKEVESDLEAMSNFGAAMVALAGVGEMILAQEDKLEAWAQEEKAKHAEAEAAEQAALAERVAADPELGVVDAGKLFEAGKALAKTSKDHVATIRAERRGSDQHNKLVFTNHDRSGVTRVVFNGIAVSAGEAIKLLAECSIRSALVMPETEQAA